MSLIQIDKKAAADADVNILLDRTYALADPLGTPALFLNPDDFPQSQEHMTLHNIEVRMNSLLEVVGIDCTEDETAHINETLLQICDTAANAIHLIQPADGFSIRGQRLTASPPYMSCILTPSRSASMKDFQATHPIKDVGELPDLPASGLQQQFQLLWHEIGHGTGAEEPQAEAMSAVMCKRAFADNTCLRVQADLRAIDAMLEYKNRTSDAVEIKDNVDTYGWPMVEVNDYIHALPAYTLDQMSEDDIKAIRLQEFDFFGDELYTLGHMIEEHMGGAFEDQDLGALDQAVSELQEQKMFSPQASQIISRFQLACQRVQRGAPAYEDGNDIIEEDLLETEKMQPLTFTPGEYIPQ